MASLRDKILDSFNRVKQNPGGFIRQSLYNATPIGQIRQGQQTLQSFGQRFPNASAQVVKYGEPVVQGVKNRMLNLYNPVSLPTAQAQYPKNAPLLSTLPARFGAASYNTVAKPVLEGIFNAPRNIVGGATNTGLGIGNVVNTGKGYKQIAAGIGQAGKGILDIEGLPFAGSLARNVTGNAVNQTLKGSIQSAATTGAKFGGLYGLLEGFVQGKDEEDIRNYITGVAGNTAIGAGTGAVIGAGIGAASHGVGKFISLFKNPPDVEVQLRDLRGRYAAGQKLVKPKGMSQRNWDFQLKFNKKYNRNPYDIVSIVEFKKALDYEAKKRVGFQARDINVDKNPLNPTGVLPNANPNVAQPPVSNVPKVNDEAAQSIRDALLAGDIDGAKALHKDLSIDTKLPSFEQLQKEVGGLTAELGKTKAEVKLGNAGEFDDVIKKMKAFLRTSGEKADPRTGELYREHIPVAKFGISSDEIAADLGKSESEFMAELTKDIKMLGDKATKESAIRAIRVKVDTLKSIDYKLDPRFYQVIKEWDNKLRSVSAMADEKTQAKIIKKQVMDAERAAKAEFNEWQAAIRKQTLSPKQQEAQAIKTATGAMKINTTSPSAKNPTELKDISGWQGNMRDVYRNFKQVYGNRFDEVKRVVLDPFDKAKGNFVDMRDKWANDHKANVVDRLGIKKKSKESAAVQLFGEKKIDQLELIRQFGEAKAKNIMEADTWYRKSYDTLIDTINATRKRIYPNSPEKWIAKRKDYYRHFREMKEGIGALFNIFDTPSNISSTLSGISEGTKPKSKFLSIAQQRKGPQTDIDAVSGFNDYLNQAAYATNIDPHIERFRGLADELAQGTTETKNVNNFIEYLQDFANDLSGKTNPADRFIQKIIPGGRTTFKAINWINSRVKSNAVIGNVSSALSQIMNVPQGLATAGPKYGIKGIGRTLAGIFTDDPAIKQSTFIKERYSDPFSQFDEGIIANTGKFAKWMTGALDRVGSRIIWNSALEKAKGLNIPNPIKYADEVTRSMVAGRGIGEVPLLQKSRMMQLVAPFQLEVQNLWWVLKDMKDEKAIGKIMTFFVANHLMNKGIEAIRGSDVTFDPIQSMMDGYQSFQEEDDKTKGALKFVGRQAGEVLSNVPFGQTAAALYPEYGATVGDTKLPTRRDFFGKGNPVRSGSGLLAAEGIKDPLYKLIPSYGGAQIKKTVEGVQSYMKGASEDKNGNIRFPIDKNPINAVKSAVFGQYSSNSAREYFNENRRALGENQSAIFKAGAGKDYYNQVLDERKQNKLIDKVKESLKTGESVKEAAKTSYIMDGVEYEGYKIGDKFVYQNENGESATKTIKQIEKIQRQDDKGIIDANYSLITDRLKRNNNTKDWIATTRMYIDYLKEYQGKLDPKTEAKEQITVQNKIEDLEATLAKYKGYGGFTKGKSKKTISDAQLLSAYKKALEAANAPAPRRRVQSISGSIKPVKLKRVAVRSLR